mgnify:FL=1
MTAETQTPEAATPIDLPPVDDLSWETIQNYDYSGVMEFLVTASMQILTALAVFVIGRWVVRRLVNFVDRS